MSYTDQAAGRRAGRILVLFTFLYFFVVFQAFQGNTWQRVESIAGDQAQKPSGRWFKPFTGTDWTLLGVTALADFADMDSSYSMVEHSLSVYNSEPQYGTIIPCPPGMGTGCWAGHRTQPGGEGNPLITGLFGTRYPTAIDYTAFGALELATQTAIAWALPERWRTGAWGLFIGIGAADTVMNSYGGGVTFRF